ncbi:MAG: calcium-binding protein, partial [Devosiaceae bacterium]|nr:calcium-binding protein [Devosiaceae bacterium]
INYLNSIENLIGSAFDDRLTGDANDNVLTGGAGNDTLTGGAGNDTFVFDDDFGADVINDWQDTGSGFEDVIDFSGNSQVNSFGDITVTYVAGNAVLTTPDGSITLIGITSGIDAGDFEFIA